MEKRASQGRAMTDPLGRAVLAAIAALACSAWGRARRRVVNARDLLRDLKFLAVQELLRGRRHDAIARSKIVNRGRRRPRAKHREECLKLRKFGVENRACASRLGSQDVRIGALDLRVLEDRERAREAVLSTTVVVHDSLFSLRTVVAEP